MTEEEKEQNGATASGENPPGEDVTRHEGRETFHWGYGRRFGGASMVEIGHAIA